MKATTPIKLSGNSAATLYLTFVAVLFLFLISGRVAYRNTQVLVRDAQLVTRTHEVLITLEDLLSLMKDAETGQRGFVVTGEDRYLLPHANAVASLKTRIDRLQELTKDNADQQARIPSLKAHIRAKLDELDETIKARKDQGFEAAKAIILSDRGKAEMDSIRAELGAMKVIEQDLRKLRFAEMDKAYQSAISSGLLTGAVGVLLAIVVAYLIRRVTLNRQLQDWLLSGQLGLSSAMSGDLTGDKLGEKVLRFFAEYLNAQAGVFFVREADNFKKVASYGVPADGALKSFDMSDGLLGQAVKDNRTFVINDIPDGYLTFGSAFGKTKPRHMAIVPVSIDGLVLGLFELGFQEPVKGYTLDLLKTSTEPLATSIRSVNYRVNLQNFLEETQRQAEELQAQGEELRVSNEELEEQSRALKETQARLELQQTELEQTNSQLEEQTQILESQKEDVMRSREELQTKAQELEQASRYKSDFLANMSHELRTPLNSSLILAKLLAENRAGNLTAEQVQYAETIQGAGNDLLSLINDILDLSKIEAGHMQIRPESICTSQMVDDLRRTFQPVALQKKLELKTEISSDCPEDFVTDRQRLEQILKNLLSNALKFTEQGQVSLTMKEVAGGKIAFSVSDTGIGIPKHQQQMVFEAFRQADGTTNRKYGGTGLGLSIARELTRLLGGEISLQSEVDRGSTFTVIIPVTYDAKFVRPQEYRVSEPVAVEPALKHDRSSTAAESSSWARRVHDDREKLAGDKRTILVVEDDESFSRIILDLTHELEFQCIVATTAEEGIAMAIQHRPSAVILDVGLPDHSGLSVLDRLKHDARTRHIPVHVVSAHDYIQTALELGAVGYMLKPVKREQLVEALEHLESKLEQRLRRILVVEDDKVQLESLQKLLGLHDVKTVGVRTAAECLACLKSETFDCMVLDLSLPDASGYSLLETLSKEDAYSFPPVIVYTGRELSDREEELLRRYSKSIIIKGAKSPERLLDEVTLFLHQMISELPTEQRKMIEKARGRDALLEGKAILIVEDDVRNIFAITSILEPRGARIRIARNGFEALQALDDSRAAGTRVDLVLMDIMMPEMDGLTAMREIRKRNEWKKLPIIALTAKAMKDDQEQCLAAGANDYMAKPLDVEKLLSLVRVWVSR